MKSGLLMGLERPATRAEQIAGHMFTFGRVIPVEELTAKLDAVDAAAVRRFGERMMNTPRPSVAVVGPHNGLEEYEKFAARFGAGVARAAE
jgi:predicted Zn-dependent peptidase